MMITNVDQALAALTPGAGIYFPDGACWEIAAPTFPGSASVFYRSRNASGVQALPRWRVREGLTQGWISGVRPAGSL
jgi:hypothetical protein